MRFSRRADWDAGLNELASLHEALLAQGVPVVDLTASNPTRCGFVYAEADLAAALSAPGIFRYEPDPRGLASARAVVSEEVFAGAVSAEHLVLTASTSEAYAWIFKILCEPGDEVLVPAPSYPLLDFLAQGESVELKRYPLGFDSEWHLDLPALEREITERTRLVVVVQPNNPTGSFLSGGEIEALRDVCRRHGLAIVSDEVFLEYAFEARGNSLLHNPSGPLKNNGLLANAECSPSPDLANREVTNCDTGRGSVFQRAARCEGAGAPAGADRSEPLTFVLGGLSKLAGLPQMKLSWIAVSGDAGDRDRALSRLELLGDTFLSVATPVQRALAPILAASGDIRRQIRERTRDNLATLRALVAPHSACRVLDPEGGWYALLRLPRIHPDEEWARIFLAEDHVLVHPGSFFEFSTDGFVVLSLLPTPREFEDGVGRILVRSAAVLASGRE